MSSAAPPRSEAIAPVTDSMRDLFAQLRIEQHPLDTLYWRDDGAGGMDFGTLADAFGATAHILEVGNARRDGCKARQCSTWWPVTLDGYVVAELRHDATGYGFTDPHPDVAGHRLS